MIFSTLDGGLGNLMFQYAFGLAIEHRLKCEVRFVSTSPTTPEILNVFNLDRKIRSAPPPLTHLIAGKLRKMLTGVPRILEEASLAFEPGLIDLIRDGQQMVGYVQSPHYWQGLESDVRRQFSFKRPLSAFTEALGAQIQSDLSISIHVRRGDYLALTHTHHVLGTDYYERAVTHMEDVFGHKATYYVFSNDLDWAADNLPVPRERMHLVRNPSSGLDFEDLYLMTRCRHHIIANSSFSWWGAFLAEQQNQFVAAPARWFTPSELNQYVAPSLYLPHWSVFTS